MGVEGLRFVITGSATGIGEATARVAASKGAKVMVSDLNDDLGEAVAQSIRDDGGDAAYQHCDVTNPEEAEALMAAAAAAFGGIDILHNNAGIHETGLTDPASCNVADMPIDVFKKVVEVNAIAPWICSKMAIPYLKESANASIINAASTGSQSAYPNNSAYGTSKGGIRLQTQNLAVDLAPLKIRVNCYGPTAIATNMVTDFIKQSDDPAAFEDALKGTCLIPRLGLPEEVAELVCFLASPESGFINAAYILIDGGSLAWRGMAGDIGM
ncbi:MAG: SDR family NAD(P)-dependent oxidoreductase [Acidimicrobiales bacterium]